MSILLVAGSPAIFSRSSRLLEVVGTKLEELGHVVHTLSVRDLPAENLLHANTDDTAIKLALKKVAEAELIVVATPVYKAAYSGILKSFLDILPQNGLFGKAVLPIATGGSQNHMLALDYALRPVLSSLSAKHILPSIYATDTQIQILKEREEVVLEDDLSRRIDEGIQRIHEDIFTLKREKHAYFEPVSFEQIRCSV